MMLQALHADREAVCHRKAAGEAQKAEQQVVNVALVAGHVHERVRARQTPQAVQAGLVYIDLRPKQQPAQRSKPLLEPHGFSVRSHSSSWLGTPMLISEPESSMRRAPDSSLLL